MRKLLLVAFLICSLKSSSQVAQNLKMIFEKDVMTDKEYVYLNEGLLLKSEDGKSGFKISLNFDIKNNVITYSGLSVKSVGIGNCVENDKLIILLENGEKLNLISWNKFNCEGRSYFDISGKELKNLNSKVKAIRFENGRSFENLTIQLTKQEDVDYFVNATEVLNSQKYELKK